MQRTLPFKALIAIFGGLQPLWPSSKTKPDLLRLRCSSGHVLSKTKSVTSHFFYISGIANSSSFNGKIFRKKKSMLEKFRPNVLKCNFRKITARVSAGRRKQLVASDFYSDVPGLSSGSLNLIWSQ